MAKIIIPTPLRKFTGNNAFLETNGKTIGKAIYGITETFPEIKQHLYDKDGKLRSFVRVFLGDTDVRTLSGELTEVGPTDTISIIPAIAGGIKG